MTDEDKPRTDLSLAHVAVMLEKAAKQVWHVNRAIKAKVGSRVDVAVVEANSMIRALIPTDAQAALDEYVRGKVEAERERLQSHLKHHLQRLDEETKEHILMDPVARNNIRYAAECISRAIRETGHE